MNGWITLFVATALRLFIKHVSNTELGLVTPYNVTTSNNVTSTDNVTPILPIM